MSASLDNPPPSSALLTDLYQLTMLDAYYRLGMEKPAVFEFFVRRLPAARNFLVAAGVEQVLDYLENVHFTAEEIDWLASTQRLSGTSLERLKSFRFTGEVYAMPEGTVFFGSEPVLRVVAPLPQAQLVESRIVNLLHYQTLVASKAARCRLVAPRAQLIDFGMRRAHGAEAARLCSRASYIAGFDAIATLEASRQFGIPAAGTMAHSFVQAHDMELEAFRNFATCHPDNVVLLIDTYDTARGARRAVELAKQLRSKGVRVKGVRIDSGELAEEARRVRRRAQTAQHAASDRGPGALSERAARQSAAGGGRRRRSRCRPSLQRSRRGHPGLGEDSVRYAHGNRRLCVPPAGAVARPY